jgi:hypothetical protein
MLVAVSSLIAWHRLVGNPGDGISVVGLLTGSLR